MIHHWVVENNCVDYHPDTKLPVKNSGLYINFCYVCTVALILEI